MLKFIQDKVSNIDTLMAEMADLKKSVEFFAHKYDELKSELGQVKGMKSKIVKLEKSLADKDAIINDMKERMIAGEQYSRRHHLEIGNFPVTDGENVDKIVCDLGKKIGCPLKVEEIAAAHRLKAKDGAVPSIIVEFVNRRTRNKFFESRKVLAPKDNKKFDKKKRIYVNESLCYYYRTLLRMAKEKCKDADYRYCWYQNNKVLVRKAEKSKAIVINKPEDLRKIIADPIDEPNYDQQADVTEDANNISANFLGQEQLLE